MNISRTSRWVGLTAVALAITAGVILLRPKPVTIAPPSAQSAPAAAPAALTVSVVRPAQVEWPEVIQASGSIAAWQEAIVGTEVSGLRLAEVLVDVGDQVTKGQLLARFDDATMLAMVEQMEAAVAEAEANVAEAEANVQRAQRLGKTGALSQQDTTQYLTRGRTAKAQIESARARLHSQKLALQYTRVVAPDDGVISARKATLGMVASPGTELFRLVRQNRLEWRAELSGAQLAEVQVGDAASVQLVDRTIASGHVRQVAPVLDESRRIGVAYVELDRDPGATTTVARAGMYGTGTITLGQRAALTLPSDAIVLRDGHEYVFVLGADGRVVLTKVDVGRRFGNGVEISAGLDASQQVVAAGAAFLNDADMVRVVEPADATTTDAGKQT
jgi:RND family efflux transporter MFP subunit